MPLFLCFSRYSYRWQLIRDYQEAHKPQPPCAVPAEPKTEEESVQTIPRIEPIAAASVLAVAISAMRYTTNGSFIITRSLGPAIILGFYDNLFYYFLGQVAGQVTACVFVRIVLFDH